MSLHFPQCFSFLGLISIFFSFSTFFSWAHVSPPDVSPFFPVLCLLRGNHFIKFFKMPGSCLVTALVCSKAVFLVRILHLPLAFPIPFLCLERSFAASFLLTHLWTSRVFPRPALCWSIVGEGSGQRSLLAGIFLMIQGFRCEFDRPLLLSSGVSGQVWQPRDTWPLSRRLAWFDFHLFIPLLPKCWERTFTS